MNLADKAIATGYVTNLSLNMDACFNETCVDLDFRWIQTNSEELRRLVCGPWGYEVYLFTKEQLERLLELRVAQIVTE